MDYRTLRACRGIGPKRYEFLLAAIESPGFPAKNYGRQPQNMREVLKEWGVPETYPLSVMPLSTRCLSFCTRLGIHTLGELLQFVEPLTRYELYLKGNIGEKTVGEIHGMALAVASNNREEARRWLPLAEGAGKGLSLRVAIRQLVGLLDSQKRLMLVQRFVAGVTRKESGEVAGVTGARVQQVEKNFLDALGRLLDAYPEDKAAIFERGRRGTSPSEVLGLAFSPDAELFDAAHAVLLRKTK